MPKELTLGTLLEMIETLTGIERTNKNAYITLRDSSGENIPVNFHSNPKDVEEYLDSKVLSYEINNYVSGINNHSGPDVFILISLDIKLPSPTVKQFEVTYYENHKGTHIVTDVSAKAAGEQVLKAIRNGTLSNPSTCYASGISSVKECNTASLKETVENEPSETSHNLFDGD